MKAGFPVLAVDAGNTRIKWGFHDGITWTARGAVPTAEATCLPDVLGQSIGRFCDPSCDPLRGPHHGLAAPVLAAYANVAGAAVGEVLERALLALTPDVRRLAPSANAAGVRNGYEDPARLGVDRWAALAGARTLHAADCLVVCAGTAVTVDWLDVDGLFRGGAILPGDALMRAALNRGTAALPLAAGQVVLPPRNTRDAIATGCALAQAGAVERLFEALAHRPGALCLVGGGGGPALRPHLRIPVRLVDDLVLLGVVALARWQIDNDGGPA